MSRRSHLGLPRVKGARRAWPACPAKCGAHREATGAKRRPLTLARHEMAAVHFMNIGREKRYGSCLSTEVGPVSTYSTPDGVNLDGFSFFVHYIIELIGHSSERKNAIALITFIPKSAVGSLREDLERSIKLIFHSITSGWTILIPPML